MKKFNKKAIFILILSVSAFIGINVSAMTEQEADQYNNLYYPQSVYNGGINSVSQTDTQEAYVDPATGSTHIKATDVTLPGRNGFDLNITRTYNSQNSALFEAYLKETDVPYQRAYYMIRGYKKTYKYYIDNTDTTEYESDICLTSKFITYNKSKTAKWMVQNSSSYEYDYTEDPAISKLFTTHEEAMETIEYLETNDWDIDASFPYSNTPYYKVDYYDFEVETVWKTLTYTDYTDSLLDDTATERYSRLGSGWEFDFPYVETRYGYEDNYEYLHFGDKGTYLIDFSSDGGENHLAGYPLNDIKIVNDTSVTHDGERSQYRVDEKDGTKHYFGKDGRLLYQEDRFGNTIKFYCDTESYMNVWGKWKDYPYITKIVDTVGREVIFTEEKNSSSGDITLKMTITNPNDSEDVRTYEYYLDKLSRSQIGIMGKSECADLEGDEWVLKNVYDPEGRRTRYNYSYLKTKFSFMDRNDDYYYEYRDFRDSSKGNSIVDDSNFEEFNGIHNVYAVVTSSVKNGYKSYHFDYDRFIKNCTPNGSMMFPKAYGYYEELETGYDDKSYYLNKRTYSYDINKVGEYDGYIGYRRDDRIGSNYNYAVKVTDGNLASDKYSYDIYKYSYIGASRDKTILLSKLTDEGTEHKQITDYTYDESIKLPLSVTQKTYTNPNSSAYMTTSKTYNYDSGNYADVLSETPNGNSDRKVTYTYDETYHFPISQTYKQSADKEVKIEYVPTSNGKSIEYVNLYENDVLKNKIQYSHDSYGNIVNQKEYMDNLTDYVETEYVYENGANVISETKKNVSDISGNAENVTVSATYDYWGNPITQTDANGNATSYVYDGVNRVTQQTNPDGSTKKYTYNTSNTREYDELDNQVRTYYTNEREIENIRYVSLGVDYNYRYYDAFGNLATEVIYSEDEDEEGNQIPYSVTQYAYDTSQRPVSKEVDDKNNTLIYKETYSYEITNDYQKKTTTIVGDENTPSIVTSEYFDTFGNKIKTEIGSDYETYVNDYQGNVLSVKSARANNEGWSESKSFEYNYMNKPTKETDELGNSVRAEYDALGRKVKEYDQNGYATEYKYDNLGRVIEQKSPVEETDGTIYYAIKKMWYDKNGNLIKERVNTNAAGETETYNEVEYTYDNRNRLTMTKAYDGEKYNYVQNYYDAKGNLLRVYTGLSNSLTINGLDNVTVGADNEYAVTKYSYDALSRLFETTDALGKVESNTYDKATGLMLSSTDRNGQSFSYNYDGMGNLTSKSLADSTNGETTVYGATGQPVSKQNSVTTINYTYNDKGLIISESDTTAGTVKSYTYDSNGNRLTFTLTRNGQTEMSQSYSYDKLNRLVSVSENGTVIAQYSCDNKGNRIKTEIVGGDMTNYAYNIAGLLTNQTTGDKLSETYTYYLNGNQKSKTSNGQTTNYEYDAMNRLISENDTHYTFDDFGNRLTMTNGDVTTTYSYDLNNRLTESKEVAGTVTTTDKYFYDYNGNQITKATTVNQLTDAGTSGDYSLSDKTDGNIALYEYDCYNRLVGVDTNGVQSSYAYSPDGMRYSKTVGDDTIIFVYDNANVIEEITAEGTNKYYRGIEIIKNDDNLYYLYNGQGDVSILADNTGNVVANYTFDAYGNQTQENSVYNPFGYRGEYTDSESGLVYLRARMYDPETGRFVNEDPARDNYNWYVYCSNNPIVFIDPDGLYDRDKAIEYAIKWHDGTNSPKYERFDTAWSFITSLGRMRGDCANFVSQCLVAGGLTMNSSWHYYMEEKIWMSGSGNHYATYNERDMTSAWASAQGQYQFFSSDWAGYKNGEVLQIWSKEGMEYNIKNNNIQKGDLMFFAHKDSGEVYHSTIISKVTKNEIKYAAHTSERDYEPLSKHLKDDFVVIVRIRDNAIKGYTN